MKNLTEWLVPPKFDDESDNKRASTLYPILLVLVFIYVALSIFTLFNNQITQFYLLQAAGITLIISLHLIRQGKFKVTAYIIPSVFLLAVTISAYNGQGIHDVIMLSFPMIIALSGLLIGKDAAIYSAFGGVACAASLIWMEINNPLVSEYQSFTDFGDLFVISVFLFATAIIVYSTMDIISKNIQELKQLNDELEKRVALRTAQLESTNKDLEAFAYSISHDLRAPLRSISGYSQILHQDFRENIDETGQRYLQNIYQSAKQMNTLIDEILALSRAGQQGLNPRHLAPQEIKEMVQGVLSGLVAIEEDRQIEIVLNELPGCHADPVLLKQVFVNLLSNAFKFTRKRSPARIEIGSQAEGTAQVYYVCDNGTGFDMAYADKLFGVFQRLHREEEYEGTGVGLAIVQRIVTRHNGRVWANATPDQGAGFYFTLNLENHSTHETTS